MRLNGIMVAESTYGIGLYTASEAARMIGMQPTTLRRWLRGYGHDGKREPKLWAPQYAPDDDDGLYLGFRDLIEARVVNALRAKGFGLPTIRACVEGARAIVGDERPFSTRQFKTDGRSIFLEVAREIDDLHMIDLKKRQWVFRQVIEPSLGDLEFGERGAERWWLLHGRKSIVADPNVSFGQPVVADIGISTARVAQAVKAEGSVERTAKIYEIPVRLVRDALAYESQLHNRKAA